jgi:hypothetical protein
MRQTLTGGCLCGAIRFECGGEFGPASYCHCEDCRRCTGSAFNVGLRVEAAQFRIVGKPRGFTTAGESGNRLTRHFCQDCGSPIYTASPAHPNFFYVKAGSLDDPSLVRPAYQSWTKSMVPWALIDAELPAFSKGRS